MLPRPTVPRLLLLSLLLAGTACSQERQTPEDLALLGCLSAVSERLGEGVLESVHDAPVRRVMIGKRPYGWLVRGLSIGLEGDRSFECRADSSAVPARITAVELCAPRGSPWGCPDA